MSERMNKERAIEILKTDSCYECTYGCRSPITCGAEICPLKQATQVAIESLDNTMTNREYMHLVGVQAILDTKFDLDKPLQKDFVKFLYALNQVEPYERKE